MVRYILRRLLALIPVLLGVSFLIYFVVDLAPGDYITATMSDAEISDEKMAELRDEYDLDRSVFYRYGKYMWNMLHGDMGKSFQSGDPVIEIYLRRLPNTVKLAGSSVLVCLILSLPLGIIAALKRGTLIDNSSMVLGLLGLSMPNFWLGLLLMILFSIKLGWLPATATDGWKSVIMPALTLGTSSMAVMSRTTRSSMLDVLREDYLDTVRAKGLSENKVIMKHAFKNGLLPILTVLGNQFGHMLGGSVVTESVFTWPGVGKMIIDGVNSRDTNVVVGALMLTTIGITLVQLIVDLLYAAVDPRIRARYAKKRKKK